MADHVFTDDNFAAEVLKSELPVVVDFFAEWCGPCKMMAPVIDQLATEYAASWKIGKCNVDDAPQIAEKYGIQSIPTLLFFRNGEVVDKMIGFSSKEKIVAKLV